MQRAHYDAAGTRQLRESLTALYVKTHLDQQHNRFYSPAQFWERLETLYAPGRDFGTVAGRLDDLMVGYAFGSPRDRAQGIWDEVRSALPDVPIPEQPEPVYIFREFAVDPRWQRSWLRPSFVAACHARALDRGRFLVGRWPGSAPPRG